MDEQIRRLAIEYIAKEQARCVADLAIAIAEAQALARSIGADHPGHSEAWGLYERLELARQELEAFRRGGNSLWCGELPPEWGNFPQFGPLSGD
jgi:hypothetical protein